LDVTKSLMSLVN